MENKRMLTQKNLMKGAVPFIGCSSAAFIVGFLLLFGIFLFIVDYLTGKPMVLTVG